MIILCGLAAAGCAACSREIQPAGERNIPEGQVRVVMPVQAGQMECVTRTADEDTVNDLNVYLFDAYSRELVLHSYLTSMELEFNCVPGNYELYVIANAYADLGELQYAQVTDRTVNFMVGLRSLPMSAMRELQIEPAAGQSGDAAAAGTRKGYGSSDIQHFRSSCHERYGDRVAASLQHTPARSNFRRYGSFGAGRRICFQQPEYRNGRTRTLYG